MGSCSGKPTVEGQDFAKAGAFMAPKVATAYVRCDFSGLHLVSQDLSGLTFDHCKFVKADLSGAILVGCEFTDCDLSESQWMGADCRKADFAGSNLKGARMRSTYLPDAKISEAQVTSLAAASKGTIVPNDARPALQGVLDAMEASAKATSRPGNPMMDALPALAEEGYRKKLDKRLADEKADEKAKDKK